jgi:diaminohydroxyphosphoribosylaminopyrimidine deaminase/5-amino-6-(5-phosphoribosylamino)uracil reductase
MHEQFLLAALEQARLGRGYCAPNPCVGAVAVHNGRIIAQAFHHGMGTPHAEQLLLTQLPPKMPGISLYVTLEPCNHWGKTPPCVKEISNYGIEHVFFACYDPNPLVAANDSTAQLKQLGIQVTHIPLKEIDAFYESYIHWTKTKKPFVTVKIAQSFDGKIGRLHGERLILSNALCAQFTHSMRAETDVIITSAKTIKADNPQLNARLNGLDRPKRLAIIDTHLSLTQNEQVFSTATECLLYHKAGLELSSKQSFASKSKVSYYPMPTQGEQIDLHALISHLGMLGYHDVLVEAGGAVFSTLHQEGLVDRTYLYMVPIDIGEGESVSAYQKKGLFTRKHRISWHAMQDNMIACMDWLEV